MIFSDLREYVQALEKKGELKRVTAQVHWDEEIGGICEQGLARGSAALLFENITDYNKTHGRKVLANTTFTSKVRVYTALNVPDDSHPLEAMRILRSRCKKPVKPVMVETGSCKEVVEKGDEVNLLEFPVPKWHGKDGGRYFLTLSGAVTKDPQTGWVNIGNYRGMLLDRNSIGMLLIPMQHWAMHADKYRALGKAMPMAVFLGGEPVSTFVSMTPFPAGVCEYDIAGAIREKPLELVKCETVDLPVPASAEIVLEGELLLDPASYRPEGPFGEYPGYYTKVSAEPRPVFKVHCVTHREDPIILGLYEGYAERYPRAKPCSFLECIPLWDLLESQGVVGITGVYGLDPFPTCHAIIAVSVEQPYFGQARQIAAALWGNSLSAQIAKYVIVVNSDVDITDPASVWLAIANRTRPGEDLVIYPRSMGAPLDPSVSPDIVRQTGGLGSWDRVLIDATWPADWQPRPEWGGLKHPVPCAPEPEIMARVRRGWEEYGID